MLRWKDGKRERGCEWHRQGVYRNAGGSVCVDAFVMPSIAHRRPLAVTVIMRSPNGREAKEKLDAPSEREIARMLHELAAIVEGFGWSPDVAAAVAKDTGRELALHADAIHAALQKTRPSQIDQISDDDIPF